MTPKRIALALVSILLGGCGINLEDHPLPAGHPASADTPESPYTPPPNLLSGDLPVPPPRQGGTEHHHHGSPEEGTAPAKPYPLNVCLVGGEELGKMGKPAVITYDGREIKFCCSACVVTFSKDPAKYLQVLDDAQKKEKPKAKETVPHHEHGEGK